MKRLMLVSALGLALAACGQKEEAAAPAPAAEPASTPVAEPAPAAPQTFADRLQAAIAGEHRAAEHTARDGFRNPAATLGFFGLDAGQSVIEITPGAGWYTEILAPALKGQGKLMAAIVDPASASSERAQEYYAKGNQAFRDKLAAAPDLYGEVVVVEFSSAEPSFGAEGSADLVVTFRNVHNWTGAGTDQAMFNAFFSVLKPGGVLGVVEHRAAEGTSTEDSAKSGYLTESNVIGLAEQAGFQLAEKSEINANPKDTKDHPNGVWNLPPVLRVAEGEDKAKYEAIGESDRMTLKFVKPAAE
jgi:predicted methyltransferase